MAGRHEVQTKETKLTVRKLLLGTAIVFTMLSPAIAATMMDEGDVTAEMRTTEVCSGTLHSSTGALRQHSA